MNNEEDLFEKRALEIERNMYKTLYEDECVKRKDLLGKLTESDKEEQYQNTLLAQKCSDLADELNEAKGLANALIDDYTDLIRICTAIYKWRKESVKEMINQSTGGNDFEKFKNHLGI